MKRQRELPQPVAHRHDELFAEISDMSDRSAEAGDAQLEEDKENFERRTRLPIFSRSRVCGDRHGVFFFFIHVIPIAYE
jgi:hypothetical protein